MEFEKFRKTMFPGQQENEQIYLVVREHGVVFFLRFLAWFTFVVILLVINWAVNQYLPDLVNGSYGNYFALFKSVYMLFLILGLLIIWTIYYLNVQVVTNERVVDITQGSLLNHTISELHLTKLEDVTSEVNGILGTFFNFGNVYIQTAGAVDRFTFRNVPEPAKIEKLILDLYEQLPENIKKAGEV